MAQFEALIPPEWGEAVITADRLPFWVGTGLLIVVTLVCLYLIFRFYHRKRLIGDTPTSKIHAAAQGYVELEGEGLLLKGDKRHSPLSGRQCLWYKSGAWCIEACGGYLQTSQRIINKNERAEIHSPVFNGSSRIRFSLLLSLLWLHSATLASSIVSAVPVSAKMTFWVTY